MSDKTYVVGIGASAGGLDAFKPLLANLKKSGQHIYIIAQHMATNTHMQLMSKLVALESALPVLIARHEEALQVDHVYLIPSGHNGYISNNQICLKSLNEQLYAKPSVNVLLSSIAKEYGTRSAGIILSGAGTDGADGCRAIKSSGGLTIAQTPESAQYDGMPMAAIEAGVIEYVLEPEEMGAFLASWSKRKHPARPLHPKSALHVTPAQLATLLKLMKHITGLDFFRYKEETLVRRIKSRVVYLKMESVSDYIQYCVKKPDEMAHLKQMFLVTMSCFFRDKNCFDSLQKLLAEAVAKKNAAEAIQVLVPASASGEECFTIAMILAEIFDQKSINRPVMITGVDLNETSILRAERGIYEQSAFKVMDAQLIQKYFIREESGYRVAKRIKDMCRFIQSDIFEINDSIKYDLISCRNLLIYLKPELQQSLIEKLYHDLNPEGLLFLGQVENIGLYGGQYFTSVDYFHRIYRRRHSS